MNLLSDNVIPGNHGKIFSTDAKSQEDLDKIFKVLKLINGVKDVILSAEKFPKEFTIHTSKMVEIKTIEDKVKRLGFHAIPKGLFQL
jgi:hypothetical protein